MFDINIENLKTVKENMLFKKHQVFLLFIVSVVVINKKVFKEQESIEILNNLRLINSIKETVQSCLKKT